MKYRVVKPLMHKGVHTRTGETVELSAEQAKHLVGRIEQIAEPKGAKPDGDNANTNQGK